MTALELGKKIKAGEVTVREAVRAVIEQAKEVEPAINSYVTLDEEGAYAQADEIQKKIDAGELTGPLAGVPVAIKDNMCIEGHAYNMQFQDPFRFSADLYSTGG